MMGQHKFNPTVIAAKSGKLPPRRPEWADDELFKALPEETRREVAMLTGTLAALGFAAETLNPPVPEYGGGRP